ncbi:hypothetical protein CEXT_615891 [Caerostris extrusa]|uniref:Uncharacterized protein n=1 Tax=Caerostris extrusa TaxID=172846 RepID=A0AAV4SQT3_CAEEX|nr:hypothetical protein CEXT_615891 [Caerostris extrusa]
MLPHHLYLERIPNSSIPIPLHPPILFFLHTPFCARVTPLPPPRPQLPVLTPWDGIPGGTTCQGFVLSLWVLLLGVGERVRISWQRRFFIFILCCRS